MKTFITVLLLGVMHTFCFGQSFKCIQSSLTANDSSYYDIKKIDENRYWVAGENGILVELNNQLQRQPIAYPNQGVNILCISNFDANHIVLCADKGIVYHYYKNENKWQVQHIKGFQHKVFYKFVAVSNKVGYLCGGNSKIALSKKAIPNGFVLQTLDGGITWHSIYKSLGSMIWDLDTCQQKLYAVKYNFRGSRLLTFDYSTGQLLAKSIRYKMLVHEYNAALQLMAGAPDFHIYKSGSLQALNDSSFHQQVTSLMWDVVKINQQLVGTCCNGHVFIYNTTSKKCSEWQSPTKFNLYGICPLNADAAILIGSNKTILKLDLTNSFTADRNQPTAAKPQ